MAIVSRGFRGRGTADQRLPPGQHEVKDFPVLSAGPTPHTPLDYWSFTIDGLVNAPRKWTWKEIQALPRDTFTTDIHCVTSWSRLGTSWEGVSIDTLLEGIETSARYVTAYCDGGYTTNVPLDDLRGGKGHVVFSEGGRPLPAEHGGPARLLVPHLYLWKSAKWVRGLTLMADDKPGFWESLGYNNRGDPWREERYRGD